MRKSTQTKGWNLLARAFFYLVLVGLLFKFIAAAGTALICSFVIALLLGLR